MTIPLRSPYIESMTFPQGWGRTGCLIVIPARNEADRIGACLAALDGQVADVLVIANNCTDETGHLSMQAGAALVNCTIYDGGVGAARRFGMTQGLRRMQGAQCLMTSDADCRVAPDWVIANRFHLDAGAAAVCGLVHPIPEEHAALPPGLLHRTGMENRFLVLKARVEQSLTGAAGHEQTPGASLAFTLAAYRSVGGFDPMPTHEDRAIILRLKARGLPVVHARDVVVKASCRLEGRAPGGMAAALLARSIDPDAPLCPDLGRSEVPAVAEVLDALGPLHHPADLPEAIAWLEQFLERQETAH